MLRKSGSTSIRTMRKIRVLEEEGESSMNVATTSRRLEEHSQLHSDKRDYFRCRLRLFFKCLCHGCTRKLQFRASHIVRTKPWIAVCSTWEQHVPESKKWLNWALVGPMIVYWNVGGLKQKTGELKADAQLMDRKDKTKNYCLAIATSKKATSRIRSPSPTAGLNGANLHRSGRDAIHFKTSCCRGTIMSYHGYIFCSAP